MQCFYNLGSTVTADATYGRRSRDAFGRNGAPEVQGLNLIECCSSQLKELATSTKSHPHWTLSSSQKAGCSFCGEHSALNRTPIDEVALKSNSV